MQQTRLPLPAGVSPVDVGRLGLWLLGRRSHNAAKKRIPFPKAIDLRTASLLRRAAALICGWEVWEYPGAPRCLGAIIVVRASSAERYLRPSRDVPRKHAIRLAEYLESHASECEALAAELRAYAGAERLRTRKKGLAKRV